MLMDIPRPRRPLIIAETGAKINAKINARISSPSAQDLPRAG